MGAPISADLVNAIVDPVVEVIRSCLGVDAQFADMGMTRELDPPPNISVTIEFRGQVNGPVTWVFTEDLARRWAHRMLEGCPDDQIDEAMSREAVAELANIASGNATGTLMAAGYNIEIMPPHIHVEESDFHFADRRLVVSLDTEAGPLKVIIGVKKQQ